MRLQNHALTGLVRGSRQILGWEDMSATVDSLIQNLNIAEVTVKNMIVVEDNINVDQVMEADKVLKACFDQLLYQELSDINQKKQRAEFLLSYLQLHRDSEGMVTEISKTIMKDINGIYEKARRSQSGSGVSRDIDSTLKMSAMFS